MTKKYNDYKCVCTEYHRTQIQKEKYGIENRDSDLLIIGNFNTPTLSVMSRKKLRR